MKRVATICCIIIEIAAVYFLINSILGRMDQWSLAMALGLNCVAMVINYMVRKKMKKEGNSDER